LEGPQKDVGNPTTSQGGQTVDIELTPEENQVIELLRTPKLSIKYLDEEKKQMIRQFIQHLHHEKGISLSDIAKLIGNKTSGYTSWLARQLGIQSRDFEEARLAGIHKKVRKYERRPFDGTDEDKAYLLGMRYGDLYVSRPFGDAIRVSTSTTIPAMAKLFTELFSPYGHVYKDPRHKTDIPIYEWNIYAILDNSFEFLLTDTRTCWDWVVTKESTTLSYLAGIWDSEGSVGVHPNARVTAVVAKVYNTDTRLLDFVAVNLRRLGYNPHRYLDKQKGEVSPTYKIEMKKDYFKVGVYHFEQAQSLIRRLPIRHGDKVARKELALSLKRGDYWKDVKPRVDALRKSIQAAKEQFAREAQEELARRHSNNKKT
jgi:hypothetical protein